MKKFIDWVQHLDQKIMDSLWDKKQHPRFNSVMSFFSHPPYWRHVLLLIIITVLIIGSSLTRVRIGLLLIAIILSDQTCNLIKAFTKRIRPNGTGSATGKFWKDLGNYSFPSSHSANNFSAAVLTLHWWLPIGLFIWSWALIVAFSRVYLRSHYPSDVIVGGLVGIIYGLFFIWVH
jgi:undecaprenyl-diphosphatase